VSSSCIFIADAQNFSPSSFPSLHRLYRPLLCHSRAGGAVCFRSRLFLGFASGLRGRALTGGPQWPAALCAVAGVIRKHFSIAGFISLTAIPRLRLGPARARPNGRASMASRAMRGSRRNTEAFCRISPANRGTAEARPNGRRAIARARAGPRSGIAVSDIKPCSISKLLSGSIMHPAAARLRVLHSSPSKGLRRTLKNRIRFS
jgi:hypothetical protein